MSVADVTIEGLVEENEQLIGRQFTLQPPWKMGTDV